jgi:outer membrane immunogenic protein
MRFCGGTMRLIQFVGAGLIGLVAAATPALAADMPIKAPVAKAAALAPVFNWTGFYAGVHAGYGWGHATVSDLQENNKHDGWLAGGQAGYNVQYGNWVFGAEIDGAWTNIENDAGPGPGPDGYVRIRDLLTARLRTGPAIGNTFYYLTGGFASGKVKYIDFDVGPLAVSKRHSGYAVGIGAEHAFAPNWSAKLEYLYVDLGDKTYPQGTPDVVDVTTHIVRAGVNYRFATGKSPSPVVTKY